MLPKNTPTITFDSETEMSFDSLRELMTTSVAKLRKESQITEGYAFNLRVRHTNTDPDYKLPSSDLSPLPPSSSDFHMLIWNC